MKIVLEESDLLQIVEDHIKEKNVLGLATKPFSVELVITGDEVTANLETNVSNLVAEEPKAEAAPKKRRARAKAKAVKEEAEPAKEEAKEAPVTETPAEEPAAETETTEEVVEEKAAEETVDASSGTKLTSLFDKQKQETGEAVGDDNPPFATDKPKAKSIFGG